jgi:hypothetical protein
MIKDKKIEEVLYRKTSLHNLILFSIYLINSKKEKCTYERLVKECFSLFPDSFCFSGIKKWPDSRKLDRSLRTLRKQKFINGDPKTIFSLTSIGKKIAEDTGKTFRQVKLKI